MTRFFGHSEPHSHYCLIYDDMIHYRNVVFRFIRQGLEKGEKCVMATEAYDHDSIVADFEEKGLAAQENIDRGRLTLLDVTSSYSANGGFDPDRTMGIWQEETRKAVSSGFKGLRAAGEASFAMENDVSGDNMIYYENIINQDLFPHYPFTSLCIYDKNRYPSHIIKAAIQAHPGLIYNERLYDRNIYYIPPEIYFSETREKMEIDALLHNIEKNHDTEKSIKESEARFKSLFYDTKIPMLLIDPADGCILDASDFACEYYGYPYNRMINLHMSDINVIDKEEIKKEMESALQLRKTSFYFKHRLADGQIRDVQVYCSPVRMNRQTYLYSIIVDITDKMEIEKRLQQAQKMESVGTLAGGIAHDFNNILFPLIGHADLLKADLSKEDTVARESLDEIMGAAFRARELIQQILTFSRAEQDHKGQYHPLKLQLVVKECLKLLRSSIPRTIRIDQYVDPECGMVRASPTGIHQILMNLVTNSFQAMEESGGNIKVALRQVELDNSYSGLLELGAGAYACLSVSDTGPGIEKDVVDKIFDPYFTTKGEGKGTGLGLSVVHGIVKGMKGDINVYTEPGEGTEFHVYLPVAAVNEAEMSDQGQDEAADVPEGREHILLVDDEQPVADIAGLQLERLGYTVTKTTSSKDAFKVFEQTPDRFDLVLSDLSMPEMNGIKLAGRIKELTPDIPVIICTGFSDRITDETIRQLGIDGYILKPFIKKELADTVRRVLDHAA
ncbi:MAG: MEDS domain-containing protein [Thermodesulfobacteriota bacterium]